MYIAFFSFICDCLHMYIARKSVFSKHWSGDVTTDASESVARARRRVFAMRGTALALLALVATAQEARSVPTRFLEGALGSPAVRPPSLAPTRLANPRFPQPSQAPRRSASPDLTLSVSSDRQAALDGASTSSKHDLYAHMPLSLIHI